MKRLAATFFLITFAFANNIAYAKEAGGGKMSVFDKVANEAVPKNGVKEITYEQFVKIRKSKERYILLDVLSAQSYANGHIEGAEASNAAPARMPPRRLSRWGIMSSITRAV